MEWIQQIAEYRNTRIRTTLNSHGLREMIYHIVKRVPNAMQIYESAFDYIDREHIVLDEHRDNANNVYFTDGHHTYHFNKSKSTLYMIFEDMELLDEFEVEIVDDPYELLEMVFDEDEEADADVAYNREPRITRDFTHRMERYRQLCLRLYATDRDGRKYVPERSGLNQWNANGRARDVNEIYIPYLKEDRERDLDFFPPRDTPFTLALPDGTEISAKVCQRAYRKLSDDEYENLSEEEKRIEDEKSLVGKSIMSNPNKVLGQWLLRDVLQIEEGTVITYDMLRVYNIDCVVFTKREEGIVLYIKAYRGDDRTDTDKYLEMFHRKNLTISSQLEQQQRDIMSQLEQHNAVQDERIRTLSDRVDAHNRVIERTYKLEGRVDCLSRRVTDLSVRTGGSSEDC